MPSLDLYKKMYSHYGNSIDNVTNGMIRKIQSDEIMEYTWNEDLQSKIGYIYDYYHDDQKDVMSNLNPQNSNTKIPVEIKYIQTLYSTIEKDPVPFQIQFKPSFDYKSVVDYYDEMFTDRYFSKYPLGLYIDIPDNKGNYQRWLCVDEGYTNSVQFDTWSILRTDYQFRWIKNGLKHSMWGVMRSQSSYNSGIWTDFKTTSPEDQQKFILPLNRISEQLVRDQRLIIDTNVDYDNGVNPIAWKITKVHRLVPHGLTRITLAEDKFDQHNDVPERNEDGKIIGFWANYNDTIVQQNNNIDNIEDDVLNSSDYINSVITYAGAKPQIRIGGSYKTFTAKFYDESNTEQEYIKGTWSYELVDSEYNGNPFTILTSNESGSLNENQIKIKIENNLELVGSIMKLTYDTQKTKSELLVELIAL